MANELEIMREIRIKQQNIRISLKKREEQNKVLRSKITPIWTDPCKKYINSPKNLSRVGQKQRTIRSCYVSSRSI